ncbi:MAG TPA: MFS transporter [Rhizomicrobium sp.]|nr:MFS transporter [Rhizomicrobium sp.]
MSATPETASAAGEASEGSPAAVAAVEAQGGARLFLAPGGLSASGDRVGSPAGQFSWAMYEWARNPYVLVITIYLFAPYFANEVVGGGVRGQGLAGAIQSYSGIIIAVLAPFLGAIADSGGRRKPWIALYTVLMAAAMLPMWFAMPHSVGWQLFFVGALIAAANVAFEFSAVFHNSLLPSIASPRGVAGLSGLGLAVGNAAGIVLLLFILIAFSLPGYVPWSFIPAHPLWGIDQAAHEPERLSGPLCAIWLIVFSIPLFLFTRDRPSTNMPFYRAMVEGVKGVIRTTRSLRHYRNVGWYLLARLFFNDGMTAVLTFGGIYASSIFHWGPIPLLVYGIELSIFAVLGGFVGGWLDNAFGSKRAIFISIGGTTVFGLLSLTMAPDRIFWFIPYDVHARHVWSAPFFNTWPEIIFLMIVNFIAVLITAGYANSRTMLARIAPTERMAEFFGLYSLSGQSTSFLATGFVSWLTLASQSQRIGLLGEILFLAVGLALMVFVKEERAAAV